MYINVAIGYLTKLNRLDLNPRFLGINYFTWVLDQGTNQNSPVNIAILIETNCVSDFY